MCDISGFVVDNQMNQIGGVTYKLDLLAGYLGIDLCQGQRSKVTVNKKPCMQFYQNCIFKIAQNFTF